MSVVTGEETEIHARRHATARSRERTANALDLVQGFLSKNPHQRFAIELALARAGFRFVRRHPVAALALTAAGIVALALSGRPHARHLKP
jgi:uncharacterized membrane protein YdfJ with MMPL/SSD domain